MPRPQSLLDLATRRWIRRHAGDEPTYAMLVHAACAMEYSRSGAVYDILHSKTIGGVCVGGDGTPVMCTGLGAGMQEEFCGGEGHGGVDVSGRIDRDLGRR